MKMRLRGFLAVSLLSIFILSHGMGGSAFADSHNLPPVSLSTELPSYDSGDRVNMSGSIKNFDSDIDAGKAVVIKVTNPNGDLVTIGQPTPESDGTFTHSIVAGGPLWKDAGDYTVEAIFSSNTAKTIIVYTGGEILTCTSDQEMVNGKCVDKQAPPPPPPPTCADNQELIDGECVDIQPPPPPPPPTCADNQELIDGECIDKPPQVTCGDGTVLKDGICVPVPVEPVDPDDEKSSCLIATAAYGSEMAPQVQFLREIRDNTVMSTSSGLAFMTGFNQLYYSFSPTIADMERENPAFRDAVRTFITPMISSLSIMTLADSGSEAEVLGLGIAVIMLNLGMYIAAPALVGFKVHKHIKSKFN